MIYILILIATLKMQRTIKTLQQKRDKREYECINGNNLYIY